MDVESFRNIVPLFANRREAGRRLAVALRQFWRKPDTVIVAVPRGGVIVAAALAEDLMLPVEILPIRKLETPGHPDLAMGSIGPGDVRILVDGVIKALRISDPVVSLETMRQSAELRRQMRMFRANELPLDFAGKTVILVDDGIGSGATLDAALAVLRRHHAARIVVAVPIAPPIELERLRGEVDEFICLESPGPFFGIGFWYHDFPKLNDADVLRALENTRELLRYSRQKKESPRERVSQAR